MNQETSNIEVFPATADRWDDLEKLFGPRGAYSGCWCMFWRLKRSEFNSLDGEGRKEILKNMTLHNEVPGVLAYSDGEPVGWCSIGPRAGFHPLENSRTLRRMDDVDLWSIVCFFVAKPYRKKGFMTALLRGAIRYAMEQGARIVEAYPLDMHTPKLEGKNLTGYSGFMGIASVFEAAGFVRVAEASETQVIMRYTISTTT